MILKFSLERLIVSSVHCMSTLMAHKFENLLVILKYTSHANFFKFSYSILSTPFKSPYVQFLRYCHAQMLDGFSICEYGIHQRRSPQP